VSISPAGNQIAFIGMRNGTRQLYVRALDSPAAMPMAGTEGAYCTPIFSPDGQSLAFFDVVTQELKKIAAQGGPPLTLVKAGGMLGATWGGNDEIVYSDVDFAGLKRIPSAGGTPVSLTQVDASKGETAHRWPAFLPGGNAFLFTIMHGQNPEDAQIVAQRLDTGQRRQLVQGGTFPQYAPAGYLAYVHRGKLLAVPFDVKALQVRGQPVPVSEDVQESGFGASQFGLSSQGSLVYVPPNRAQRKLLWVSRNGTEQLLAARAQNYGGFRLSPDGRRVAVEVDDQIWLYDLSRDVMTRFTFRGDVNRFPLWSPDGKWLAFQSNKDGPWNVFWQRADGSGEPERLTTSMYENVPVSWSPDGNLLAFVEDNAVTRSDIWILRISDRKVWPILQTQFSEGAPVFSPDGNWLAYLSDESGRYEVYVRPYPGPGAKYQVSTEGGVEPMWNPKGNELFYRSGNKMIATEVITQSSFAVGEARELFEGPYATVARRVSEGAGYDVSGDGVRFLMDKQSGEATHINVVLNWFEELKRRVPSAT
jgi:serine/threonine-protein kinase